MTIALNESVDFSAPLSAGNKWRVKVIESGWGSSGYYGSQMLESFGPKVFKAGTKVFMNHPSRSESSDRPERDVHQLAGKLVSDAIFMENALYADVEFYSHYAPIIREMADDVGLSISALGNTRMGEAEGREGHIVESLVEDPLTSLDVVTVAGAGGKFISLYESYIGKGFVADLVTESVTEEGNSMSITKEELEAAVADLKATLVEAISPLVESVSVLVEAATPVEGEEAEGDTPPDSGDDEEEDSESDSATTRSTSSSRAARGRGSSSRCSRARTPSSRARTCACGSRAWTCCRASRPRQPSRASSGARSSVRRRACSTSMPRSTVLSE